MDWNIVLVWIIKTVGLFFIIITGCAYYTLAERRVAGFIQDRKGPNRAGPFGIFQPIADGIKFLTKEEVFPINVSKAMYFVAPAISIICAIAAWSIIPFGGTFVLPESVAGIIGFSKLDLQIVNPDTGILFMFAISSLSVYGIILAGWSSNNKYSLMGGIRSTAQMISYELPLGLSVVTVALLSGSLRLTDINDAQKGLWFVFTLPGFIAFYIFTVAAFAETNRLPFDLAEAESELVVGFHTEYGAFKFALFFIAEYMNLITMSCVISLLFFGGYNVPFGIMEGSDLQPLLGIAFFSVKVLFFAFLFMWVRWTLPRFRYDQLMNLGWKKMVPWGLANIIIGATYVVFWGDFWKGLFK
ncbi:MAG: NADH-quinone oxidoreductase subunit NuoH [Leptospiraceae bacterium]|nr:NADH-quinone oxidoreductase subunit NuoH [Leptospiraceae bacterium]MCP5497711.1 NADH-quinone oxidoreductase subunit NuoH [Leptospiraceae bacterium]